MSVTKKVKLRVRELLVATGRMKDGDGERRFRAAAHVWLTELGIDRRRDGNKLGLRARLVIWQSRMREVV